MPTNILSLKKYYIAVRTNEEDYYVWIENILPDTLLSEKNEMQNTVQG